MKKFYKTVSVAQQQDGFEILLDEKKLKTPLGAALISPTRELAEKISSEWSSQKELINHRRMPLTQLLNTSIDHMKHMRKEFTKELLRYALADPTCFRVSHPKDLADLQNLKWDELHYWMQNRFGLKPAVTLELSVPDQVFELEDKLKEYLDSLDPYAFTALQALVTTLSSLFISIATLEARYDAEQAFSLAYLDELYQIQQWGYDDLAKARHDVSLSDTKKAVEFLILTRG